MTSKHPFVHRCAGSIRLQSDETTLLTPEPIWLRPEQVAQLLGCSTSSLAKWRLRGDGPSYAKLSRLVLYERAAIDRWLRDRLRHSTSETQEG